MPIRVEIYAATGVAVGVVTGGRSLREVLEGGAELVVERAAWHPLDGSPPRPSPGLTVAADDIHLAIAEVPDPGPIHAQWHDVAVRLGPYRVTGQLPTMPGFDPGRALARPTGEFVLLRDVRICLGSEPDGASVSHPTALVNRYVVDEVAADLMLGFFFPGAGMVVTGGHERAAAGASAIPGGAGGQAPVSAPERAAPAANDATATVSSAAAAPNRAEPAPPPPM